MPRVLTAILLISLVSARAEIVTLVFTAEVRTVVSSPFGLSVPLDTKAAARLPGGQPEQLSCYQVVSAP